MYIGDSFRWGGRSSGNAGARSVQRSARPAYRLSSVDVVVGESVSTCIYWSDRADPWQAPPRSVASSAAIRGKLRRDPWQAPPPVASSARRRFVGKVTRIL